MIKMLRNGWIAIRAGLPWARECPMCKRRKMPIHAGAITVIFYGVTIGGFGATSTYAKIPHVCDTAAQVAALETGVPLSVLLAITRVETGRNDNGTLNPWPWTVNMNGEGHWFANQLAAEAYAQKEFLRGARSFDLGCFQINHKWHGTAFLSIGQMLDPVENARYAALFLQDLHSEVGDWSIAAGAYHSRRSEFANEYRMRFDRILAELHTAQNPVPDSNVISISPKTFGSGNSFPFLQVSGLRTLNGSLVPIPELNGQRTPSDRIAYVGY